MSMTACQGEPAMLPTPAPSAYPCSRLKRNACADQGKHTKDSKLGKETELEEKQNYTQQPIFPPTSGGKKGF